MSFPDPYFVQANGLRIATYRLGPEPAQTDKPPIIFLHGWPELAYSWRFQMQALADEGYCVLAYDQRGYGRTERPDGVAQYRIDKLAGDVAGVLDAVGMAKAVIIGHDWGALVTWSLLHLLPDRLIGVGGLNVPYLRRRAMPPIQLSRARFGEQMYIVQFQEEGRCEPLLEADTARTMRCFMRRPRSQTPKSGPSTVLANGLDFMGQLQGAEADWPGETWLSEADMAVYADAFARTGFTAPLHWYRNFDANWHLMAQYEPADGPDPVFDLPALMMTADRDAACPPVLADDMVKYFPRLTRVDIQGAGHWLQQERPDEVNTALLRWLDAL